MQPLDWFLTALPLVVVIIVGFYARTYMRSVVHFLSGGRVAGRYLLAVAGGELQAGAAVFAASFEQLSKAGFAIGFWGAIGTPIALIVGIAGFVSYRRRETRALTLAQFFELRYSRAFRLCTGFLGFFAGIINFGIIPMVGARFIVCIWELPQTFTLFSLHVPTYIPLMAVFLTISAFVSLSGGVITLIVINCIEGIISQLFYLIIIVALLAVFNWQQVIDVIGHKAPGHSMLNPFDSGSVKDFNLWFVLMGLALNTYATGAWQNAGAYSGASLSPHEGRMGGILGRWREMGKTAVLTIMGICAIAYLSHHDFAAQTASLHAAINQIPPGHDRDQMAVPLSLSYMLPAGVKGLFCAILLMGIFGGDATHLLSWGSIFVQDIVMPLRKTAFTPAQHLWLLRLSIIGVAVFAFLFGCIFRTTEYIFMWWTITTAVYVGGAGACIIGGLYWKKGTTAGAYAALFTGSFLSVGGIVLGQIKQYGVAPSMVQFFTRYILSLSPAQLDVVRGLYHDVVSHNGTQISFVAMLIAIVVYVVVSLLTCREDFNMERMLHRGKYAKVTAAVGEVVPVPPKRRFAWSKLIGIDENFTRGDKWIAGLLFGWGAFWFCNFFVVTIWNLTVPWPEAAWARYWHVVAVGIPIFLCVVTGIWFTWGGIIDMRAFFRRLDAEKVNPLDDGRVVNHQNVDELAVIAKVETTGDKVTGKTPDR
jgi:SSS family solute:Na+ symporter